jgi:hypothetical protein
MLTFSIMIEKRGSEDDKGVSLDIQPDPNRIAGVDIDGQIKSNTKTSASTCPFICIRSSSRIF